MAGSPHPYDLEGLALPSFANGRIVHFFGTRLGPRILQSVARTGMVVQGPPPFSHVASLRQVHGQNVVVVDRPVTSSPCPLDPGDALVTDQSHLVLTVRTADCVPVFLADEEARAVAAIHAGWRGALGGIVAKTVALVCERFGCTAASLRAAVGPSIGGCCYEVGDEVVRLLRGSCSYWRDVVKPRSAETAFLDLKGLIVRQLTDCGIPPSAIGRADHCTRCEPERFFSYRRDGLGYSTMLNGIMLIGRS